MDIRHELPLLRIVLWKLALGLASAVFVAGRASVTAGEPDAKAVPAGWMRVGGVPGEIGSVAARMTQAVTAPDLIRRSRRLPRRRARISR